MGVSGRWFCLWLGIAGGLGTSPGQAVAPWQPEDAAMIDRESTDLELTGDMASFEFLPHLEELWQQHQTGYRVSGGSLDINKLYFRQDFKFAADPLGPVDFSFRGGDWQDLTEKRQLREAKLAIRGFSKAYIVLLGFSDRDKAYGDLGGGLEWRQGLRQWMSLSWLSVDNYFNDKKDSGEDRYRLEPWLLRKEGRWQWTTTSVAWQGGFHGPLRWYQGRADKVYEFSRREGKLSIDHELTTDWQLQSWLSYDHKEESSTWLSWQGVEETGPIVKGLSRRTVLLDAAIKRSWGARAYLTTGVRGFWRDTDYRHQRPVGLPDEALPEALSSDVQRRDTLLYLKNYRPMASSQQGWLFGLYVYHPRVLVDDWQHSWEIKPQVAWEYRINDKSQIVINTTYDLDEAVSEFPYRQGFPGWDGGNAQFQLAF